MKPSLTDALEIIKHIEIATAVPNSCIISSLIVRDVMRGLGFPAEVKSVALELTAQGGTPVLPLYELGVGMNKLTNDPYEGKNWDGHLIVSVPGFIIDPTFGACRRTSWEWIPDIAVVPRTTTKLTLAAASRSLPVLALWQEHIDEYNYDFLAVWAANSFNTEWKKAPDARPDRRRELVQDALQQIAAKE